MDPFLLGYVARATGQPEEQVEQLNPEELDALLNYLAEDAQLSGDQQTVDRLRSMADENRALGAGELADKGFMAGRVYVPPSPWQGAAQLSRAALGAWQEHRAQEKADILSGKRGEQRQTILQALMRRRAESASPGPPVSSGVETQVAVTTPLASGGDVTRSPLPAPVTLSGQPRPGRPPWAEGSTRNLAPLPPPGVRPVPTRPSPWSEEEELLRYMAP